MNDCAWHSVNTCLLRSRKSKGKIDNFYTIFEFNRDRFVLTFHEKPTMERESQSGDSDGTLRKNLSSARAIWELCDGWKKLT